MKIVLFGYMGSGKSSVGKQLATKIRYNFFDLDAQIEEEEANTVSKIFIEKGEIYFRRKEYEVLRKLVSSNDDLVISTGGGTPCYGDVIDFLRSNKSVVTIYLNTSLDILTNRLYAEKSKRPLIEHLNKKVDLHDFIRKHLFERSFYYNQAGLIVKTDLYSIEEVVEEIVGRLF